MKRKSEERLADRFFPTESGQRFTQLSWEIMAKSPRVTTGGPAQEKTRGLLATGFVYPYQPFLFIDRKQNGRTQVHQLGIIHETSLQPGPLGVRQGPGGSGND
jgi:hypothetical protein